MSYPVSSACCWSDLDDIHTEITSSDGDKTLLAITLMCEVCDKLYEVEATVEPTQTIDWKTIKEVK